MLRPLSEKKLLYWTHECTAAQITTARDEYNSNNLLARGVVVLGLAFHAAAGAATIEKVCEGKPTPCDGGDEVDEVAGREV